MKTKWFQNKKILMSINITQILLIFSWLGYLLFFTTYKYKVIQFFFSDSHYILNSRLTSHYPFDDLNIYYVLGICIEPYAGNPGYLILKAFLFFGLPILILYRIWIYRRLNSKKIIKNLQFGFIALSTLLLIQTLTQFLLFKKIFPVIDETTNSFPVYIWYGGLYNGSHDMFNSLAISQAKIFIYSGAILYFAAFVSISKTVIIPYIQKKKYLKKNMKEIASEHEKLITNLKN